MATLLAPSLGHTPAEARERPSWFWEWSDGSVARARVMAESEFVVWSRLPTLIVASSPPTAGRTIRLEMRTDGAWVTEDIARTDAGGRAELALNPYCRRGDWCAGASIYRLVADDDHASLRVTFTPSP